MKKKMEKFKSKYPNMIVKNSECCDARIIGIVEEINNNDIIYKLICVDCSKVLGKFKGEKINDVGDIVVRESIK